MKVTDNTPTNVKHKKSKTFKQVEIILILIFSIAAILCLDILFYPSTLEDAYITFRYSEHFSEGYGFGAWNITGERVEGYTSFLWMISISGAHALGIDVRTAAKVTGIFMHLLLTSIFILYPLLRQKSSTQPHDIFGNPNETVLAGVFLALYLPLSWYASSGMETVFFSALTGLIFIAVSLPQKGFLLPFFSFLIVITRPEGIVIAGAAILLEIIKSHHQDRQHKTAFIAAGVALLSLGLLMTHRLLIFGEIVPNTYWAKAGGASLRHVYWGARYMLQWVADHQIIVFLISLGIVICLKEFSQKRKKYPPVGFVIILLLVIFFIAYIIKVGGDKFSAFPYWRHMIHIAVPIALLCSYSFIRFVPKSRFLQLSIMVGIAAVTNLSVIRAHDYSMYDEIQKSLKSFPSLGHTEHSEYYLTLKNISQSNTTIASSYGGELPYVVDAVHIDNLGLNTRYIAKNGSFDPAGPQDSKTDMRWVLEQHPDIVEGYIPGTLINTGSKEKIEEYIETNKRSKMHKELVSSPIFQDEYCFITNWPYDEIDRAIFIRESYFTNQSMQEDWHCISITNTPLKGITYTPKFD